MKNILLFLGLLLLTSCGSSWNVSTLNHDSIYQDENYINVEVLNEFQFRNKLRTDIGFRLDFAQYALSQPRSFDWNNRLLGRYYNSSWNSYYWNRDQMWNDWAWGFTPHRWSPFGYDRWGYNNYYGWNNYYSWNNYYGWNNWGWNNWGIWNNQINPNWGRSYINGRRSSTRITSNRRVVNSKRVINAPRTRTVIKNKPRVINNKPRVVINNKPRINNTPRIYRRPPVNNTRPSVNVSRPSTNSRSISTSTNPRRKN